MCGRYLRRSDKQRIAEAFRITNDLGDMVLPDWDYNVEPTTFQPVIRLNSERGERELVLMRWGLVPWFAKSPKDFGYNTINAKAETLARNRMWEGPLERRRCLVPADGFYEWQSLMPPEDGIVVEEEATATLFGEPKTRKQTPQKKPKKSVPEKQPYAFTLSRGAPFAFAGLWDRWRDPDNRESTLESFTIITTDPNELTAPVHSRMPVILFPGDYSKWLTAAQNTRAPVELLKPFPAELMQSAKANQQVGNVRNNHPGMLDPASPPPANSL